MTFESCIFLNNIRIAVSTHSDGAVSLKLPSVVEGNYLTVQANIKDASGLLALMYLLEHLDTNIDYRDNTIILELSYFPNARQDRVTGNEEVITPNTAKMFANFLNSCKRLEKVYSSDVHSNVPLILMDKLVEHTHKECYILTVPLEITDQVDYFISPDLGAYKKVKSIADNYELPYLVAHKERNPITHQIELSLNSTEDLAGKTVMICDDICDGGRTFLAVSKILKETYKAKTVYLYITHGIFPFGYDHLKQYIDKIYVNSCWLKKEDVENSTFIQTFQYF